MIERTYIDIKGPLLVGYWITKKDDGTPCKVPIYTSHSDENIYECIPLTEQEIKEQEEKNV